ncbi:MAG TPA: MgtC/SapB family protein, partial [Verrucomicrobiales bacterium]|nr:MgtC/SapB family protein [Verrucomicrobiales bacterium]
EDFLNLGLALGLGLLVGLQRERAGSLTAGFRTFALTALLGGLCAVLGAEVGNWLVGVGLAAVAALAVLGAWSQNLRPERDPGLTTEVALLVMFLVGAAAGLGRTAEAVVLGAATAVLLHLRPQLHGFARKIGDQDMRAIMQFVVVALVVLPLLPNRTFGPFDVFNPHRMWWLVVLITGISLGSYVAYKLLGSRAGSVLGGILGGLISSTATTVTYARKAKGEVASGAASLAAMVILLAAAVVFARVLVLSAATAPAQFFGLAPPLAAMLVVTSLVAVASWWRSRRETGELASASNPTELKMALSFAALYAVVLFALAAAKHYFGERGLYAVAVLSGLTDMDAITLSTAQLAQHGDVDSRTAGRVILVASLANLMFKGGIVLSLGSRAVARRVLTGFAAALAAGVIWLLLF